MVIKGREPAAVHHLKPSYDKMGNFSLGGIRDAFFAVYAGFRNAVNYDEMASTAMMFFAIREGGKILKGTKRAMKYYCRGTVDRETGIVYYRIGDDAYAVIRDHRSTLFAFKSLFDDLVGLMLTRKRVDLSENDDRTSFADLVVEILNAMDVRPTDDWKPAQKMCTTVLTSLNSKHYDGSHGGDAYKSADRFNEFFATKPLLNVAQLYWFYAYEYL